MRGTTRRHSLDFSSLEGPWRSSVQSGGGAGKKIPARDHTAHRGPRRGLYSGLHRPGTVPSAPAPFPVCSADPWGLREVFRRVQKNGVLCSPIYNTYRKNVNSTSNMILQMFLLRKRRKQTEVLGSSQFKKNIK